jgi:hypothetical protein
VFSRYCFRRFFRHSTEAQTKKNDWSERSERERALERLIALSTEREELIDWDVLERVDELAWSDSAARRRLLDRIDRDGGIGPDPEEPRRLRAP